ncbi:MAG: alpha/beta hydrolase family protein [Eubacteriales bacterium]|nr:alpha/beta hydrolase family protein [Eubacteriales bacterium]
MAIIHVEYLSEALMRTVPVEVILPVDKLRFPGMPEREEKPFKTLYLLHGVFGSSKDWLMNTTIQQFAEEKNLAVVMPCGENRFYIDQKEGHNLYGEFIGKELVSMTRKMFPLSHKKEDTYIAGLSMGGYGALRNGLKYHETFGAIAALSTALITDGIEKRTDAHPFFLETKSFAEQIFGDLNRVKGSDMDPYALVDALVLNKNEIPHLFMACGTDDSLLPLTRKFQQYLKEKEIPVTCVEESGNHEWNFWGQMIRRVLEWLPLEEDENGINSGNVGI